MWENAEKSSDLPEKCAQYAIFLCYHMPCAKQGMPLYGDRLQADQHWSA
jgi:hypothetical protein